ncbi:MAG: ABC transporter permease [Sandaracinus sp.]
MSRFSRIGRRLGRSLVVVWLAMSAVFVLTNLIGDPAVASLGPRAHESQIAEFRRAHQLDRPFYAQYAAYFGGLVTGDLGRSYRDEQPVLDVLWTRMPRTMLLGAMALVLELILGVAIGIVAALRKNTFVDTALMSLAFLGVSTPSFLLGLVFLQVLAFRLGLFPVGGYGVDALDHVRHGFLPAFTLAVLGAATYARLLRSELVETLRADYVRTARAKGMPRASVVLRHALRNALLPIVTVAGLSLPLLVGGAIITESIYDWPGVGRLAIEAIYTLDVPVLLGVVLFSALAVQVGNVGADLVIAWLDPRVAVGEERDR